VFTTVHANNVVDVLGRFLNMGVEPYNFVSALNCILAQRLVRLICDSCRTAVHYPSDVLEASGLDPQTWAQVPLYEGQGCIECAGTGFKGRTAIHELLDLTDRIREMILAKKPTSSRPAPAKGMRFCANRRSTRSGRGDHSLKNQRR
jgi:type IV pilus assembly protein PilB